LSLVPSVRLWKIYSFKHQPRGLGISAGTINIVFFAAIVAIVAYLTISKIDIVKSEG
jgi:hypothetical protein